MYCLCVVLAVASLGAAADTAPSYVAANIVKSGDFTPGPFAPNSVVSIFGTNLSWSEQALGQDDIVDNTLPTQLANTRVYVDNVPVPLLYVSGTQINFIVPPTEIPGDVKLRVVREGVVGPEVTVTLVDAAPSLFVTADGYAIATHADNSVITTDAPAHAGELVVIYACGLGKTVPNPAIGEVPEYAALLLWLSDLKVSVGGSVVDAGNIKYAGLTPGSVGLYQINVELPAQLDADPELRLAIGQQSSPAGIKLAVR